MFVRQVVYLRAMDTIRRGNAAEAAVLNAFIRADLHVFIPFGEGSPYDLLVHREEGLLRVQVKCGRVRNDCIEFNTCSTDHGRGRMSYVGRADVFGVYVPELDRVFIVPVEEVARYRGYLRLAPARNNQQRRIKYASDYAIEDWARSLARANV
jgi:PD-(D/E)XK endonuclease